MDTPRKLAAILAADIAGYSRLMGLDEAGTAKALREHRAAIDPILAGHGGRVFKTTGDGMLVEFPSVVGAVESALAVQKLMAERNADVPEDRRMLFRIGINLGDVLIEGDDILGDGVNVAARLEGIADPGGICISDAACQHVRDKVPADFIDIGEQALKNIARPVRTYRVARTVPRSLPQVPSVAIPRLSMIVLPFVNIGGNEEQEFFTDGVTESLTTDLSRIPDSFVIARNTAFTYKGKPVDVKQIGRELGVNYVVEGSVQRAGNRLRWNVQLIDAKTGAHLWADRFDREQSDLFEMQDEVIARLARTLDVELTANLARSAARSVPENDDALDFLFCGRAALNRGLTPEAQTDAQRQFERALAIDPDNVEALAGLAIARTNLVANFMTDDRAQQLAAAEAAAIKALDLAPQNPRAHLALGNLYRATNRAAQAISELEQALALDRNSVGAHSLMGIAKIAVGRAEEVEDHIAQAIRLSPKDQMMHAWCLVAGAAKLFVGHDEGAISWLRRSIGFNRTYPLPHFYLAIALAHQGKLDEAKSELAAGLALDPGFTMRRYRDSVYSDNPTYLAQRERLYDGLRKAGLPE
jgi:TolB-like protein/class 3 adenylate cyclase